MNRKIRTWVEISLNDLEHNYREISSRLPDGCQMLGVCKANAYGHGAVRVAVGATPGKTKHLQTCILSDTLMLCDCPGLVFPVVMNTKADLLFNGVLPASNMREYIGGPGW